MRSSQTMGDVPLNRMLTSAVTNNTRLPVVKKDLMNFSPRPDFLDKDSGIS